MTRSYAGRTISSTAGSPPCRRSSGSRRAAPRWALHPSTTWHTQLRTGGRAAAR